MKVSEIFYSIQGEGKRSGVPSFFIRTNNCNLRCMFTSTNLCDTSYTSWTPDDAMNIGEMSVEEIITEYKKQNVRDVVITGGEPTIQAEELTLLCKELKALSAYITIETNGTIYGDFVEYTDLLSISPKLFSSTPFDTKYEKMHLANRINTEVLKKFNNLNAEGKCDIQWKFVYCKDKDIDEIKELQKSVGFHDDRIYLMPEGVNESDLNERRKETVEMCRKHGYNYTDRLHIIIWGNKRGV
ncbi:MAG: 7-carboxy-7-deazaguanine synthase QueE [Ignavibacteriota bacterium]